MDNKYLGVMSERIKEYEQLFRTVGIQAKTQLGLEFRRDQKSGTMRIMFLGRPLIENPIETRVTGFLDLNNLYLEINRIHSEINKALSTGVPKIKR